MTRPAVRRRPADAKERRKESAVAAAPVEAPAPPDGFAEPSEGRAFRAPPRDRPAMVERVDTSANLDALLDIANMDMNALAQAMMSVGPRSARPKLGDRAKGIISRVARDEVFIELGGKAEAQLDRRELPDARVGDEIDVFIIHSDENITRVSRRISGGAAELLLMDAKDTGAVIGGRVLSKNAGGFEVMVGTVRAFCPISQIDRIQADDPESYVGRELEFVVVDTGDKIVLSRRKAQDRELGPRRDAFWERAKVGDEFEGVVCSVQSWGAFVDVEGVEGLLSRREYSWDGNLDLTTHLRRGQVLKVRVQDLDPVTRKVSFSTRDPGADPWVNIEARHPVGAARAGRVVTLLDFGAFVAIEGGLQGLVHRSAWSGDLPAVGSDVQVKIRGIDTERRRLDLAGLDYVENGKKPSDQDYASAPAFGTEVEGVVREVRDNGVVVDLPDGRAGWLSAREVDLTPGTLLSQRFRRGHPVKARVIGGESGRRLTLSLKADEAQERGAWQSMLTQPDARSMGTFGDLLAKARKK